MLKVKKWMASLAATLMAFLPAAGSFAADILATQKSDATGDYGAMERWRAVSRDEGGTLLFSDSPEYIKENGILYSDVVTGKGRILFYHVNETKTDKKLAVLLEREGFFPATVKITRGATGRISDDYFSVARSAQSKYFADGESFAQR